jgi:hypothetical protein
MGSLGSKDGAASALSLSFQRESFIMGLVNVLSLLGGDTLRIIIMPPSEYDLSNKGRRVVVAMSTAMGEGAEGLSNLALSDTMINLSNSSDESWSNRLMCSAKGVTVTTLGIAVSSK